jgi:3-hydroxyisobutyrate dehydrogenase
METDRPRLGFLGTGVLGAAIVERLLTRGYRVTAWNRSPGRLAAVTALGAAAGETPAAVAAASDIVMLCVLDGAAVEEVCFGPGGVAEAKGGAATLVDFDRAGADDMARSGGHRRRLVMRRSRAPPARGRSPSLGGADDAVGRVRLRRRGRRELTHPARGWADSESAQPGDRRRCHR